MVLDFSPLPSFIVCNKKIFKHNELHVTRICKRSVLILMTDGILRFREDGRDVELRAGEYYIQPAGLFQEGVRLGELPVYYYIEFDGSFSESDTGLPLYGRYDAEKILPVMRRLDELFAVYHADSFALNSYMFRIFSGLLSDVPFENDRARVAGLIKKYIDSMFENRISVSDIAKRFGYNEDHIIRIFKSRYEITPHQYQIKLRMEHARWLLENTEMSSEQAACAVGYEDFSAFYRKFKEIYGISPGQIRLSEKVR